MTRHIDILRRLGACREAIDYAALQPDLETAYARCPRGDWLLWLVTMLDRKAGVRAACAVAREAVEQYTDGETATAAFLALHITEEWCEGRNETLADGLERAQEIAARQSTPQLRYDALTLHLHWLRGALRGLCPSCTISSAATRSAAYTDRERARLEREEAQKPRGKVISLGVRFKRPWGGGGAA